MVRQMALAALLGCSPAKAPAEPPAHAPLESVRPEEAVAAPEAPPSATQPQPAVEPVVPRWQRPGPMPDGGDWSGRYHSKRYGDLDITVKDGSARGLLGATGSTIELGGPIEGDLWRYGWTEMNAVSGPVRHGRGYFRYEVRRGGLSHEIRGEWGLGDSEIGSSWQAHKLVGPR